jgi:hypothetical protein
VHRGEARIAVTQRHIIKRPWGPGFRAASSLRLAERAGGGLVNGAGRRGHELIDVGCGLARATE